MVDFTPALSYKYTKKKITRNAKPFVRKGRKAAGLYIKMAELSKVIPYTVRFFCFDNFFYGRDL